MRNDLSQSMVNEKSELKKWLIANGKDTVEKFFEFQKSDFKKAVKFSGKILSFFDSLLNCLKWLDG